ncbi:MAG: dihydropteroate synthase [Verrucomicrobiales bacterium]|nr:dihydropteroate synthase [Verrucomicrobiales bacterium]
MRKELLTFPRVMGIVNINDDSFSGDGTLDVDVALETAIRMAREGADIIDVGAESARTNREAIAVEREVDRLIPFIEGFSRACELIDPRDDLQIWPPLLSVNTWRPPVVEAVLQTGQCDIINDIGGLVDDTNAKLCFEYNCCLLIMHTVGEPKVPHTGQRYEDLWGEMETFFEDRLKRVRTIGLSDDQIILDPGIDFAKQCGDNLEIYREAERLTQFDLPILLPISRKTVIGDVLGIENPADRDAGTIACLVRGLVAQANVFRVHNVKAVTDSVRVIAAIRGQ